MNYRMIIAASVFVLATNTAAAQSDLEQHNEKCASKPDSSCAIGGVGQLPSGAGPAPGSGGSDTAPDFTSAEAYWTQAVEARGNTQTRQATVFCASGFGRVGHDASGDIEGVALSENAGTVTAERPTGARGDFRIARIRIRCAPLNG